MRLFEFANDDPLRIQLVAVLLHLKEMIKSSGGKSFSTDQLMNLLRSNQVHIDQDQLSDLISREPLKNIIQNINGNTVEFVGADNNKFSSNDEETDSETTVKSMAKRAIK